MISLILIIVASVMGSYMNTLKPKKSNAHLALKTLMIILLILAVIFYKTITDNVPLDVLAFGMGWLICQEVTTDYLNKINL